MEPAAGALVRCRKGDLKSSLPPERRSFRTAALQQHSSYLGISASDLSTYVAQLREKERLLSQIAQLQATRPQRRNTRKREKMMNGEILLSASALVISIVTIFEVKHLKPARPAPPGPAATFDRCSLPNVLGTQISPTQRESALEYVCAATVDLSLSNCIFFLAVLWCFTNWQGCNTCWTTKP